ncbi:hypothetical protein DQ04_18841000 [Trypanosoma grayi]|uniref:hypothetical protein n=1 Tax=Trypanosoma grayi TaxID=71804 RepID=UPI0004F44EAD|nr:hypothetical protein DQ04_18841000 [Trypanosoma grayi]KEG05739.1 hypothetical protein DQ04_18841000 [Trypanosoma grayi]
MMLLQYAVNCTILVLLITFAFSYQTPRNQERVDSRFVLASFLFGAEGKSSAEFEKEIESIEDFLEIIEDIGNAYYGAPESSSGAFMHYVYGKDNSTPVAPLLEISLYEGYYGSSARSTVLHEKFDILEENPLGPFANPNSLINESEPCDPQRDADGSYFIPCRASAIGELFDRLICVKLSFSFFSLVRSQDGRPQPRVWFAEFLFELSGHGSVMVMKVSLDSVEKRVPERLPVMISFALLPLVAMGFLLRIRTFPRFSAPIKQLLRMQPNPSSERHSRFCFDTRTGEGGWRWLGFISDMLTLSFSITSLVAQHMHRTDTAVEQAVTILLGFATLVHCARLVSILKLFPSLYVVFNGIVTAGRQLSMYGLAVFPILFGYSVCGTAVFGAYGRYFSTVPLSIISLFCATFGDNLIDTFLEMDQSPFLLQLLFSRFFIMTYLLFFICNVLNVAHSIIQDSYTYAVRMYMAARREGNNAGRSAANMNTEELSNMLEKMRG